MSICAADFRACVVNPALAVLHPAGVPYSLVAADLLMATAAVETELGSYLVQQDGPAVGVFQIEPASFSILWAKLTPLQLLAVRSVMTSQSPISQMTYNLVFAAAICRLFYWQVPDELPAHSAEGLWYYYKLYYNTPAGAATEIKFMNALKLTDAVF